MPLNLVADESINFKIVRKLREEGYEVASILEDYRSCSDKKVIEIARKKAAIILTEDSDFGEWVFAHKEKNSGVIFLRYNYKEILDIISALFRLLKEYNESLYTKFTVITVKKIRIRDII